MNLLVIIHRELRIASRHPAAWKLRLTFAAGAVAASVFALLLPHLAPTERGPVLLVCLAGSGMVLALFVGPALTADSLSSEKRQGTLGLLLLTPLRGWEIVVGKLASHALLAGAGWLATIPVFFLPVLHGGVTWAEAVRLLLALWVAVLVSLAAATLWSAASWEARTAVLGSAISLLLLALLGWLRSFVNTMFLTRGFVPGWETLASPLTPVLFAFDGNYRWDGDGVAPPGKAIYWGSLGVLAALGAGLVSAAGRFLPVWWQRAERLPGKPQRPESQRSPGPPGAPSASGSRWSDLTGVLPCHWLARRGLEEGWGTRWFRYGASLLFLAMLGVSVTTHHWEMGFTFAFSTAWVLHVVTRAQLALAATRRWHEDRQSGALELLLVTPVTGWEIVEAHHHALRQAFRGPWLTLLGMNAALLTMAVLFFERLHMNRGAWQIFTVFFVGGAALTLADFPALRWLALREALRAPTQLKAAGRTFGWIELVPWLAFGVAFLLAVRRETEFAAAVFMLWVCVCLLYDFWWIRRSGAWLQAGLRRHLSEHLNASARPLTPARSP